MLFDNWPVGADLRRFHGNGLVSLYLSTVEGKEEGRERRREAEVVERERSKSREADDNWMRGTERGEDEG